MTVATGAAMLALSWQLTLLTALVLPPAIWTTRRVALIRRDLTARRQRALADLQNEVQESMGINGAILNRTLGLAGPRAAIANAFASGKGFRIRGGGQRRKQDPHHLPGDLPEHDLDRARQFPRVDHFRDRR